MDNKEYKNGYEFYFSLSKYGKKQVLSYKGLTQLQNFIADQRKQGKDAKFICAQKGAQEKFMASTCPTTLLWGNRGGGKSFITLMTLLYYVNNKNFNGAIFRESKGDSEGGLIKDSKEILSSYGIYLESQSLRTWKLHKGGIVHFGYYSDDIKEFSNRLRGKGLACVVVDEASDMPLPYWTFLTTNNRNGYGMKNRMIGAMNPNPDSFFFPLIQWWLDENGEADINKIGKTRYYYRYGDGDEDLIWGNTEREVAKKVKSTIGYESDKRFEKYSKEGDSIRNEIVSISFIGCDLAENDIMLSTDTKYIGRLKNTTSDLLDANYYGRWVRQSKEGDVITDTDMLNFFGNTPQYDDMMEYATLDPAYGGENADFAVLCHWIGHHLEDLEFTKTFPSNTKLSDWVKSILTKWDLSPNRMAFDAWGSTDFHDDFPTSKPLLGKVIDIRNKKRNEQAKFLYDNLKTQMADGLIHRLRDRGYSINPKLLSLQYGNGTVRKTMMRQKSAIRFKPENNKGKMGIIEKPDMKKNLGGGESPDLIEAILYREYWDLVKPQRTISRGQIFGLMNL